MRVLQIKTAGVFGHPDAVVDLQLPGTGLVVITGNNGEGKSSLVEAVAACCWGETLRGSRFWVDGRAGALKVYTDALTIDRRCTKGGTAKLEFALGADAPVKYENNTKAQAALDALIGSFEVWRRACVFSASDAAHFTLATDKERKQFLETLLGLGRFDRALALCRDDRKLAEQKRNGYQSAFDQETRSVDQTAKQLLDLHAVAETLGPAPDSLRAERDLVAADFEDEKQRRDELEKLPPTPARKCKECNQPVPDAQARAVEDTRKALYREVTARYNALNAKLADLNGRIKASESFDQERARIAKRIEEVTAERAAALAKRDELDVQVKHWTNEVATLGAVAAVLGLKGVRAQVLSRALGGIEAAANSWLTRFAQGVQIKLEVDASDALVIAVDGWGSGRGYRACSSGQRRRIDVALLLALMELAGSAQGQPASTLWIDEAFDSLDADGVTAVAGALQELATVRTVVVISHNKGLVQAMRANHLYEVINGTPRLVNQNG